MDVLRNAVCGFPIAYWLWLSKSLPHKLTPHNGFWFLLGLFRTIKLLQKIEACKNLTLILISGGFLAMTCSCDCHSAVGKVSARPRIVAVCQVPVFDVLI